VANSGQTFTKPSSEETHNVPLGNCSSTPVLIGTYGIEMHRKPMSFESNIHRGQLRPCVSHAVPEHPCRTATVSKHFATFGPHRDVLHPNNCLSVHCFKYQPAPYLFRYASFPYPNCWDCSPTSAPTSLYYTKVPDQFKSFKWTTQRNLFELSSTSAESN